MTGGREIADIRLRFDGGRVVEASAAKNEEYLQSALDTDEGARFLGEFAFGTNFGITRFTKNILLDEKIGGTVHVAIGAGYPDSGSTNRSAIHWDLICDLRQGGLVTVDGVPFLRDGRYLDLGARGGRGRERSRSRSQGTQRCAPTTRRCQPFGDEERIQPVHQVVDPGDDGRGRGGGGGEQGEDVVLQVRWPRGAVGGCVGEQPFFAGMGEFVEGEEDIEVARQ